MCRRFSFSEDQLFHRDLQSQDLLKVISPTKNLPFSLVCCLIVAGICKVSTTIVVRQGNRHSNALPLPVSNSLGAIHAAQRDIKDKQISREITGLHYNISTSSSHTLVFFSGS